MKLEKMLRNAIKSKDKEKMEIAFEEIYNQYFNLVCFIINKYIDTESDVEELANDVFVKFYKRMFEVKIYNIKNYLMKSAKNHTINFIKKKNYEKIEFDESTIIIPHLSGIQYIDFIIELKRKLEEEEINIILLHDVYSYNFKSIAIKLQMKEATIKTKYYRAIKKLKQEGKK